MSNQFLALKHEPCYILLYWWANDGMFSNCFLNPFFFQRHTIPPKKPKQFIQAYLSYDSYVSYDLKTSLKLTVTSPPKGPTNAPKEIQDRLPRHQFLGANLLFVSGIFHRQDPPEIVSPAFHESVTKKFIWESPDGLQGVNLPKKTVRRMELNWSS